MVMGLAFSIDRDGLVEDTHAVVYKQLGAWVRACYGSPLATSSGAGDEFVLHLRKGDVFDRFQLVEDIVTGQRIRNYTITMSDGGSKMTLVNGDAVGQKRIHLLCVTLDTYARTPDLPYHALVLSSCKYERLWLWLMTLRLSVVW